MLEERREKVIESAALRNERTAMDTYTRNDKWPNQPRPNGSLMITTIAYPNASFIARTKRSIVRRKSAQTKRCKQVVLDAFHDELGAFTLKQREGKPTYCENLIRPNRCVDAPGLVIDINHIIETALLLVPETR